jgi:hypothetical protein
MTRLFNFISRHGHTISEKRAKKADSQFAADWEARRSVPGVVLGTEGPGGLDGFFQEMKTQRKYDPWWLATTLHIHWWVQKHGPSATRNRLRAFWQRGRTGWAASDTWSFDHYLSKVIRDGVRHLRDNNHGHPCELDERSWQQILTEISDGMDAHLTLSDILITSEMGEAEIDALEAQRALAFDHLKRYWGHLWD